MRTPDQQSTLSKHGLRCWWFGHRANSKCLPLVDRALITFGDAERRADFGINAEKLARLMGTSVPVSVSLIAELKRRRLISPFADMTDTDIVWAMHDEAQK